MDKHHGISVWVGKAILATVFAFSFVGNALARQESTIFTFDGKEFTRTHTTLVKENGKSAEGTKLDHASPAYKALLQKHSYSGEAILFGKKCGAIYAPVLDEKGQLTGAIFVCLSE
jgi:methyl-accepting chemotaxis protein